jgi:hypothetical protein
METYCHILSGLRRSASTLFVEALHDLPGLVKLPTWKGKMIIRVSLKIRYIPKNPVIHHYPY